jgi:DNA-binding Lrp family transcriptional regulator
MPRKTDLPERLIEILQGDPTVSRDALSKRLQDEFNVGPSAIRKHLRLLRKRGWIRPSIVVTDQAFARRPSKFWISILTGPRGVAAKNGDDPLPFRPEPKPRRPGSESPDRPGPGDYQIELCREIEKNIRSRDDLFFGGIEILLGGDWDLLLWVYAYNEQAVGRFVTRYLRQHRSIEKTSTAWSLTIGRADARMP